MHRLQGLMAKDLMVLVTNHWPPREASNTLQKHYVFHLYYHAVRTTYHTTAVNFTISLFVQTLAISRALANFIVNCATVCVKYELSFLFVIIHLHRSSGWFSFCKSKFLFHCYSWSDDEI